MEILFFCPHCCLVSLCCQSLGLYICAATVANNAMCFCLPDV